MLIKNKCLWMVCIILSCCSFNAVAAVMTIFDCRAAVVDTQTQGKNKPVLHYDGTWRPLITSQAIAAARFERLWMSHLPEFCSASLANDSARYINALEKALPVSVRYMNSFYFALGSSRTNDEHIHSLQRQLSEISNDAQLLVVGSSDAIGERQFNHELSLERARFVAKKIGDAFSQIFIIPLGSSMSSGVQPQYRRVDVYMLNNDDRHI